MKRMLVYKDEASDKFWSIEVAGKGYTVTFGRTGTNGQSQTKTFYSEEKARTEAETLVKEKLAKGYKELGGEAAPESGPSERKAASQKRIPVGVKASDDTGTTPRTKGHKESGVDLDAFEQKHRMKLAKRYRDFIENGEHRKYEGLYVSDLPYYSSDSRFKVSFLAPDFSIFEVNEISRDDHPEWVPLSLLEDELQFLAVDVTKKGCPVAMWEHEDGMFHPHSKSLDEFLGRLIPKCEATTKQKFMAAVGQADKLIKKKSYKEALAVLDAVAGAVPAGTDLESSQYVRGYHNRRGICNEHLGNIGNAIADYENALALHDDYAALNIVDLYLEKLADPRKALKTLEPFLTGFHDDYCRFHSLNYRGQAHLLLGAKKEAEEAYRKILELFAVTAPENIEKGRKDLQALSDGKRPNAGLAREFLGWFKVKAYELTPKKVEKDRGWWDGLPGFGKFWQGKLLEAIGVKKAEPTDQELARMFYIERLHFEEDEKLNDLSPLKDFKKLKYLSFHGDVEDLGPIKGNTALDLRINNTVIKDFQLPEAGGSGKANALILEAAKKGDAAGVKSALKAGADADARGDFGTTALHEAVMNRHWEVAFLLIENGADIYAQNMDEGNPLLYCTPEDKAKLEAAYFKAGGKKPESPFRVWAEGPTEKGVCALGYLQGVENDYRIGDGVPMAASWPKEALFKMRTDYPGYKKCTKLADCFLPFFGNIVVSKRVREFLASKNLKGVEYLPVKILDIQGKVAAADYFLAHPVNPQDCLDIKKSGPKYNLINSKEIDELDRLVIDEKRLDPKVQLFRIKDYTREVLLRKVLAEELVAQGFSGLAFKLPKR